MILAKVLAVGNNQNEAKNNNGCTDHKQDKTQNTLQQPAVSYPEDTLVCLPYHLEVVRYSLCI
jgi:hypothetical protein